MADIIAEGESWCFHCTMSKIVQQIIGEGIIDHAQAVAFLMQVAAEVTESLPPVKRQSVARMAFEHFESCRRDARAGFDRGAGGRGGVH